MRGQRWRCYQGGQAVIGDRYLGGRIDGGQDVISQDNGIVEIIDLSKTVRLGMWRDVGASCWLGTVGGVR